MINRSTLFSLILLSALFGLGPALYAQDGKIESSSDAKSYLNNKNMSVDLATGIFNYRIPVHEIKAGDFSLPITLDYAARGVKADDKPGILGHNWNLNVGGVVVRTLRGGISDETIDKGAAYLRLGIDDDSSLPVSFQAQADNREHDGESDIFTAVFHGRSVNFILRAPSRYERLEAIPLEPTEVKIEPWDTGWRIVDEEGNAYIFTKREWSRTFREGNVSVNNLDTDHISAWFLEQVIPADMPPIEYEYYRDAYPGASPGSDVISKYYPSRTTVRYIYGKPLMDRKFDFTPYASRFEQAMHNALSHFNFMNTGTMYGTVEYFITNELKFSNSAYPFDPARVFFRLKAYGLLDDNKISGVYNSMISTIDQWIELASSNSSPMAIRYLNDAKGLLLECMNQEETTHDKYVYQYGHQEIVSPMLKSIKYGDRIIEFDYDNTYSATSQLTDIRILDAGRGPVSTYRMIRNDHYSETLDQVRVFGKSGGTIQQTGFEYYGLPNSQWIVNIHGEYVRYPGDTPEQDPEFIHQHRYYTESDQGAFYKSLKTIRVGNDTQIGLEYQNNYGIADTDHPDDYGNVGGISITGIKIRNNQTGNTDQINYAYFPGCPVHAKLSQFKVADYGAFRDYLYYDRLIPEGPDAFVKTGNNGYYFPLAAEIFNGRGTTQYEFIMPDTSGLYNYWEIGNPVSQEFYDKDNRLKKRVIYVYDDQMGLPYRKILNQHKAGEYQTDESEMYALYKDTDYYADNIECRLISDLNEGISYSIAYNYKTYLKRIEEYDYESDVQGRSTIREFEYDLTKSTMPVRTTVTDSDGTKYIESVRRALDFDDSADPSIAVLKLMNMVGVPLQTRTEVEDHRGVRHLVSETVNQFGDFGWTSCPIMKLWKIQTYLHDGVTTPNDNGLFGFDRSKYDVTTLGYTFLQGGIRQGFPLALPSTVENPAERKQIIYDQGNLNVVLSAVNNPAKSVAACDWRRFTAASDSTGKPVFSLSDAPSLRYRLYVVADPGAPEQLTLTVNGSARDFTLSAGTGGPQVFDLDLRAVSGIQQIGMAGPGANIVYMALVPADCEFEATSYNSDGTVFCKFNQNGRMERYEYDGAGRVIKVFDHHGRLLKEHTYNVVLQ